MSITLDSLKRATQQLATENSKNEEGLSGLEYLFADDIEKDDEINLDPEPPKGDDEPEVKGDDEAAPAADALSDLKEVALDAGEDEVLSAGPVDLDDEDTVLDLSAGKKEEADKEEDETPEADKKDEDKEDEKPEDEPKGKEDDKEKVDEDEAGPGVATQGDGENADVGTEADKDVPVTEGEKIKVPCTCPMCKQTQDIEVDADAYDAWQNGELIQNAFPDLSPDEREALKTGICGKCWDKMFGGPEDFEDEAEYEEIAECKGFDKGKKEDENGKVIVEGGRKHCKKVKVHVYDIDWDVEEEDIAHLVEGDPNDEDWEEKVQAAIDNELDKIPTSLDIEVEYCPGDDLDEIVSDAISKQVGWLHNGFNFDVVKGEEGTIDMTAEEKDIDESAIGDAFKSIGQGIGGLLKTTLKGVGVLIAGLGGSFLFGLPGLLLAVCIAFGLMSAKESAKGVEVDEGLLGGVKDKLKTVLGVLKADPKKSKELNDKMLAAKKAGDKEAMKKIAGEVKALANDEGPKDPNGDKKPEGDEVEVTERNKTPLDERLHDWAHALYDAMDFGLNELKSAEEEKEDAGDFDAVAPKFVTNVLKFAAGSAVEIDPTLVDKIIAYSLGETGEVDNDEEFVNKLAEYVGGHLERIWLEVEDEDEFADAADQLLRGLFAAAHAPKNSKAANLRRNAKLIQTYIEVGGGEGLQVAERHGEFKRSKFKKDKWGDGRRGRPRPEDDEDEEDEYDDLDLVDDEDDEPTYGEVAEDDKVSLKDITADQVKAIADMDPKAREEMSKMKPEDREQAMAMLGIEVTEDDEDGEGKEKHTYTAYFDTSVPADVFAEGYSITTDEGDEYAVSVLSQVTENEAGDFPLENVTKDGEDWYDEFNEILDKLMSEDRAYFADYDDDDIEWIGMEDDDDEDDDDEEVDETSPVKQPEDPTDGKPEENIPPEYEVADECDMVKEDPCPDCGAEMREEPHTGNQRCPRCHHFQRGSYKPSIFETKDVSTSGQLQKFLKECNSFKKSLTLRKSVAKFTKLMTESPRKAQALVDQLDHQFKGKPVSERRFCKAFVKSI